MFRFALSPVRGILVFGILLALLLLPWPTTSLARNPYDMTIATEGDPGDGVLDQTDPDELPASGGSTETTEQDALPAFAGARYLLPRTLYLGPTSPVWIWLPVPGSDFHAPSASRGW